MIWRGDLPRAMRRLPSERFGRDLLSLPDPVVDRLLDATLDPADAPGPYAGVAAVLRSASSAAASTDVRGEAVVVAEMANAITAAAAVDDAPFRRRTMRSRLIPAKVAVLAAGGVLAASGVAAAATGSLPDPLQRAAARVASSVGITLEQPDAHSGDSGTSDTGARLSTDGGNTASTASSDASGTAPACPSDVKNHGQFVSSVAHSGGDVSAAARSDCGKKAETEQTATTEKPEADEHEKPEADEHETEEPEADETHAAKPATPAPATSSREGGAGTEGGSGGSHSAGASTGGGSHHSGTDD